MISNSLRGLALTAALLAACDRGEEPAQSAGAAPPPAAPADSGSAAAAERPLVVFLGTSLTAGLGVAPEQAYPALLQRRIDSAGLDFAVVNAGVSGETSAGARSRIDWLLRRPMAVLVVETGANDGLRGQPVTALRENLEAILSRVREASPATRLVVVGMEAPPNYGATYTREFREVFPSVAREFGATYVPFLLEDVAGVDALNQDDGIHPTPEGHRRMAAHVWDTLGPVLRRAAAAADRAGAAAAR